MKLDDLLDRLDRDRVAHVLAAPPDPGDLEAMERALGVALPAPYREFLRRFGGGLFYQSHEIYGPRRVVVHDIELVSDFATVRRKYASEGTGELLPIHQADGVVHAFDLAEKPEPTTVHVVGGDLTYPDFVSFAAAVVLKTATS